MMKMRSGWTAGTVAVCAALASVAWSGRAEAATPKRPNIVWLTVEDMSPWIGACGDSAVATPNLDRLAREGVVYDNAFATSPVCPPARSSLITGMFFTRIGVMQMRNGEYYRDALMKQPDAYRDIPTYKGLPPFYPDTLHARDAVARTHNEIPLDVLGRK